MKNKVKVLVIIIVLLLVAVGIYIFNNKENKYENVRIIGELFDGGRASKIIYNNKEYVISEDDDIYSIKNYNGKLYYYKSENLYDYYMWEGKIEIENEAFYEFGKITLKEKDSTYSMNPLKQVSYEEYESGNKEEIEYCISNIEGKYGFEINRVTTVAVEDDITIEKVWVDEENYECKLVYTKKDENNNVIWAYETAIVNDGTQYDTLYTLKMTNDRIYINENGTIIVLDKENGKVLWKNEDYDIMTLTNTCFDEEQNLYVYTGSSIDIINLKGENVAKINHKAPIMTDGVVFEFIRNNELLIESGRGEIVVDLSDYSIKYAIIIEYTEDTEILRKTDGKDTTKWKYETKGGVLDYGNIIINGKIYIVEDGKIIALNVETGKVLWENSDYKKDDYPVYCLDSKGSIYLCDSDEPNLLIIDNTGKTVHKIDNFDVSFDEYEGVKSLELRNDEKELVIKCDTFTCNYNGFILEKSAIVINLEDYSIKYENIEE